MIQAYNNVCLILDDNDEICTTNGYGFDGDSHTPPYEIDFVLPKTGVQKIQLSFRTHQPRNPANHYHAMISDLKIYYADISGRSRFELSRLLSR